MLFSEYARYQYVRSPLVEVICQLRFPAILTINTKEPAEFQEAVRHGFPRYAARKEQLPPKVTGLGTPNPKLEQQPAVVNHSFVSADGLWKINLTKDFIALSTLRYTQWEDFALRLDKPLAQFIQVYEPAFFERVGLRYVNAVSRKALGLTDLLWDDLIRSPYLGILGEPDVDESKVGKSAMDTELTLEGGVRMKIHAGPGLLGGGKTLLLGDLIEMQFLGNAYNPHLGSAIALVMMVIVLVCMAVMNRFGEGEEGVAVL